MDEFNEEVKNSWRDFFLKIEILAKLLYKILF